MSAPRLLFASIRDRIRARHYSLRTEKAYVHWIRRYLVFHGRRHPRELGPREMEAFLSALATEGRVAASTQNQALSALLFLYREVLEVGEQPWLDNVVRAKRPIKVPVVLSPAEVQAVLAGLRGDAWLLAALMYGSGLRVGEAIALRVQDVDLARRALVVRGGRACRCRTRSRASTLPRRRSGRGSGCSRSTPGAATLTRTARCGITSTWRASSARSARRCGARASRSRRRRMRCGTPSPRTCWSRARTSARSRRCWATRT
jgi:hypothetical protein